MSYESHIKKNLSLYKSDPSNTVTLGIETSCDDTSCAVIRGEHDVLAMCTNSQIELHREFGGVVPELASRDHVKNLYPVVYETLKMAGLSPKDITGVAVTYNPGLLGALLTGLNFAKGLSFALGIPFIGVNHMFGHISANYLCALDIELPFICLIASGGHTLITLMRSRTEYEILGDTCDDAAGEALDKIARALGLPYPGGPYLEKLALEGDDSAFSFRSPFNARKTLDMSFSGIKTAAVNAMTSAHDKGTDFRPADIAASFQRSVVETLVNKTMLAALETGAKTVAIAGGVSSNTLLRTKLSEAAESRGIRFICPEPKYCTDNGAMIACAGYHKLTEGHFSPLSLDASAED